MDFSVFLALSGAIYKFVEFVKPAIKRLGYADNVYEALVQLIACIAGVVLAFVAGGVNLLPAALPVPSVVGVVVTGVLIGLGADVVNAFIDLFYGWNKPTAKGTVSADVEVKAEVQPA